MKIEIEISDVSFNVISSLAELERRDVGFVASNCLELWVQQKISQSNAMIEFISKSENAAPEKPKRTAIPKSVKQRVFDKTDGNCAYCGIQLVRNGNWHVDHVVPISRGGKDEIENLVAACHKCNTKKSDKPLIEFKPEPKGKTA